MKDMMQTAKKNQIPAWAIQAPSIVHSVLRSPGKPLDTEVRDSIEPQFNYNFSKVRIHTDKETSKSAEAVNALAYTVGHDIVFAAGQYAPHTPFGKNLLVHELAHTVQQAGGWFGHQSQFGIHTENHSAEQQADRAVNHVMQGVPVGVISRQTPGLMRRKKFTPWPGQIGKDVPGTREKRGTVISEYIQRTDSDKYVKSKPILLSFDSSTCTVTSTMDILFKHPDEAKYKLSTAKFNKLKARILSVANKRLNGWMKISVSNNADCNICRGKTITIKVIAKEGSSANSSKVVLQSGTGRADNTRIYSGGENWLVSILGGVPNSVIWHEMGHVVLGLPDEYRNQPGDPPRPASTINESDWSFMGSSQAFGRRAIMHPRHFSFIPAWLKRRFPRCTFTLIAMPIPYVVDFVIGYSMFGGVLGGNPVLGAGVDIAAGFPLDKLRRLRILLGGYGNWFATLSDERRKAFTLGALLGMDFSTDRSAGGFAVRGDIRVGAGIFTSGLGKQSKKLIPDVSGILTVGYQDPLLEIGAFGSVGKLFPGSDRYIDSLPANDPRKVSFQKIKNDPYYLLGIRLGFSF